MMARIMKTTKMIMMMMMMMMMTMIEVPVGGRPIKRTVMT